MRYIKLYESYNNKIDILTEYLGIKKTQISITDNYTYETFSERGNQKYVLITRDELQTMIPSELDKYVFDEINIELLDAIMIILSNAHTKVKKYFYDYDRYCKHESDTYIEHISKNKNINPKIEDLQIKYIDNLLDGDENFIRRHLIWLIQSGLGWNQEDLIEYLKNAMDIDKLYNDYKYKAIFHILVDTCQANRSKYLFTNKLFSTPIFILDVTDNMNESNSYDAIRNELFAILTDEWISNFKKYDECDYTKEDFIKYTNELVDLMNKNVKGSKITLYRKLHLNSIKDLRKEQVGVYWSFDKNTNSYGFHGFDIGSYEYKDFILKATFNISDIDFDSTLYTWMLFADIERENEVKLKENVSFNNIFYSIDGKTNLLKGEFNTGVDKHWYEIVKD